MRFVREQRHSEHGNAGGLPQLIQKFEQDTGLIIQEVSAKESEGINEAFEELTKDILTKE